MGVRRCNFSGIRKSVPINRRIAAEGVNGVGGRGANISGEEKVSKYADGSVEEAVNEEEAQQSNVRNYFFCVCFEKY